MLSLQIHLYTDTVHGDVCCIQIRCMHGETGGTDSCPIAAPIQQPHGGSSTGYPQRLSKETPSSSQTSIINTVLQKKQM